MDRRRPSPDNCRVGVLLVAACLLAAASVSCGRGAHKGGAPAVTGSGVTPSHAVSTTAAPPTPTSPAPTSPAPTSTNNPAFAWTSVGLDAVTRARMQGVSWHPGCPVTLDQLRLVTLNFWGFDGRAHRGQLVVHSDSVTPIVNAFRGMYQSHFPIRQVRLVEDFAGSDEQSMAADNTSAFNCRVVPGSSTWSQHAYGRAVDIDPLENPEVNAGQVDPPSAAPWADRTRSDPAMIRHGDAVWQAFAAVGWAWGGDWTTLKDYQHFSANGL